MSYFYKEHVQRVLYKVNKINKPKFIIGVDGPGGSGKSTFATELLEFISNVEIVKMDDFYKPENLRKELNSVSEIGAYFDWRRLEKQLLIPFVENLDIRFQKYNWNCDSLNEWQYISKNSNVIVEGVYSTRPEISKYYDLKIWIYCPADVRLLRGIERDGLEKMELWQNVWMKQENEYLEKYNPISLSDININGNNV